MYHLWPWHWPSHLYSSSVKVLVSIKDIFFFFNHISFFLTIFSYTLQKLFKLVKNPFFFILKVDNLWPWPWPSHINFSNQFDIFSNSCYYYLCEYVKGFINILWEHCKILFQNMTKLLFFFYFFENVPFVTLTLTFTFIFIICLGLVSIKDTLFYITILVLFLPSSATLHKKGLN